MIQVPHLQHNAERNAFYGIFEVMAITLTYNAQTSVPVEIEGLTPDWACDKSLAEIERFEIFHGNRKIPLAEMFTVAGDASDKQWNFEGNLSGVHWIGAHMASGVVRIHGSAGRHVGSQMQGGEIVVHGNAGGWVGSEMKKGLIHQLFSYFESYSLINQIQIQSITSFLLLHSRHRMICLNNKDDIQNYEDAILNT